jgi:hypothetical protein
LPTSTKDIDRMKKDEKFLDMVRRGFEEPLVKRLRSYQLEDKVSTAGAHTHKTPPLTRTPIHAEFQKKGRYGKCIKSWRRFLGGVGNCRRA